LSLRVCFEKDQTRNRLCRELAVSLGQFLAQFFHVLAWTSPEPLPSTYIQTRQGLIGCRSATIFLLLSFAIITVFSSAAFPVFTHRGASSTASPKYVSSGQLGRWFSSQQVLIRRV
jgi:hypothetical protein